MMVRRTVQMMVLTTVVLVAAVVESQVSTRSISINGTVPNPNQMARLQQLEQLSGVRLPDGAYWYDARSGAFGVWGGPTLTIVPAGLDLGGPMPANCSGGGTAVFVNGRELHPGDVAALQRITPVYPGRYWLDANGWVGYEGGGALINLFVLARQAQPNGGRGGGGSWGHTLDAGGGRDHVGGDGNFTYFMGSDGTTVYID
jgi:hypothetical protein